MISDAPQRTSATNGDRSEFSDSPVGRGRVEWGGEPHGGRGMADELGQEVRNSGMDPAVGDTFWTSGDDFARGTALAKRNDG